MIFHKKDLEKIQDVLKKFPDAETFEITCDHSSGIGAVVTMTFDYEINGLKGSFSVEISGVGDW